MLKQCKLPISWLTQLLFVALLLKKPILFFTIGINGYFDTFVNKISFA